MNKDYYLGLDIGTNSVGWAVTDKNYKLMRAKGKDLWGVRLFDEAETAAERRVFRSSRRMNARKKERIKLLQEIFAEEINKVDESFFQRIKESKYYLEDKSDKDCPFALFNDKEFTDKEYNKKYPTIYHLRKELIDNNDKHDIRLVYLAIHNIIKNRGHFLLGDKKIDAVKNFDNVLDNLVSASMDLGIEISCNNVDILERIIKNNEFTKKDKSANLLEYINIKHENKVELNEKTKLLKELLKLITGQKIKLRNLFGDEEIDKKLDITFDSDKYEEEIIELESVIGDERISTIDKLKKIYDWSILAYILDGEENLSEAKVKIYDKHKKDLESLKYAVKKYLDKDKEKEIFDSNEKSENYVSYTGHYIKNKKKQYVDKRCNQERFCNYIEKCFKDVKADDDILNRIKYEVSKERLSFMPKQVDKKNSVIPYQLHLAELEKILNNASEYYDFLNEKDSNGYTAKEKIIKLLTFRIPYYVGPLNDAHKESGFCWIEKKSNEKIYPWNFDEIVDKDKSAENFIRRMTSKCTYLIGEDVIPDQSILYSKFKVLNELNNMKINGEKPAIEIKKRIYNELFLKEERVTVKKIEKFFKAEKAEKVIISGIDGDFKNNMASYIKMKKIIGDVDKNIDMIEKIIMWSTVLGSEKGMLKKKIKANYSDIISDEKIAEISKLTFKGWGRLSKKLLTEIRCDISGNINANIIEAMYETNYNFMQLLSNSFEYIKRIEEFNKNINSEVENNVLDYHTITDDLYTSPSVKRAIWQTVVIVDEIRKVIGNDPKKIFVEMTRRNDDKKRTISRKNDLINLYKNCKDKEHEYIKEFRKNGYLDNLEKMDESTLRSRKIYLYYTQMGRDIYTGEPIEFASIFDNDKYDIDHIYPRSKTKDDSITKNLVLTNSTSNSIKSDNYPINPNIQKKQSAFWNILKDKKLISKEKYNRLTRKDEFTDNDLAGFIDRQIVFTGQSTKAVTNILQRIMSDSQIVYAKAENTSDFRKDIIDFVKVREINDHHHAHDAYLAIVVGNVYDVKFTRSAINFVKSGQRYSLKPDVLYSKDIKTKDEIAWIAGANGTEKTVRDMLKKTSVLFTRYSYCRSGKLFDAAISKTKLKQKTMDEFGYLPIKNNDKEKLDMAKYGGYNKIKNAYYIYVEYTNKNGERERSFERMPIHISKKYKTDKEAANQFVKIIKLKDPIVLIDKVKMRSLVEIDGYKMYIGGKTDSNIYMDSAYQLKRIDKKDEMNNQYNKYIKKLIKYKSELDNAKKEKKEVRSARREYLGIDKELNVKLFDVLYYKMTNTIYKNRPGMKNIITSISQGREKIKFASINDQVKLLTEIIKVFKVGGDGIDLTVIGGSKSTGILKINKKMSNKNSIILINQSPTGLYERKIDLLSDELANSSNNK